MKSPDDIGGEMEIPFIPLILPMNKNQVKIKDMLEEWMYDNTKEVKRFVLTDNGKIERMVSALDIKNIMNIPQIIALSINRFQYIKNNDNKYECIRDLTDVFIKKKISLFKNTNDFNVRAWEFKSVICHRGDTINNGHYYCLIKKSNDYYIFNDLKIPSIKKVNMNDNKVTDLIKKECVFIIYSLYPFKY